MGASATSIPTQQPSLSPAAVQPAGTAVDQTASNDAAKVEGSVRPAVILVTIFDPKGNLLRTETGFFISSDGRVATTARGLEGGANAVAKMGDGGIYNVSGILALSKELNLAVLQADAKKVPFLEAKKKGIWQRGHVSYRLAAHWSETTGALVKQRLLQNMATIWNSKERLLRARLDLLSLMTRASL
jgi:hypothetical protein